MSAAEDYKRAFLQLLPPTAYVRGGYVAGEAQEAGQVLGGLDENAEALIEGMVPPIEGGSLQCPLWALSDWERVYGLPSIGSYELRNARLLAAIRRRTGIRPIDIQEALKVLLGYKPELTEQTLFRTDDPDSLTDQDPLVEPEEEVYKFFVTVDGDQARDGSYTRQDVERIVEDVKPGHTQGVVQFTGFYTDDSYSLTDKDLLAT